MYPDRRKNRQMQIGTAKAILAQLCEERGVPTSEVEVAFSDRTDDQGTVGFHYFPDVTVEDTIAELEEIPDANLYTISTEDGNQFFVVEIRWVDDDDYEPFVLIRYDDLIQT